MNIANMMNIAKREDYERQINNLYEKDRQEMYEWLYKFSADNLYIPTNLNIQNLCLRMIVDWAYSSYYNPLKK